MPTDFTNLRPLILTKLSGISALVAAYDKHTENVSGYPCATFEPASGNNQYYTNTDNLREYSFDIIIYQEMKVAGRDAALDNLCIAVDAVVAAFESDTTLRISGGCHYVKAVNSDWGEFVNKAGPVKYAKLVLVCGVEVAV